LGVWGAIAFGECEGRSLFWDVGSCDLFWGMWGAIAKRCCKQFAFWNRFFVHFGVGFSHFLRFRLE
jgi:hypothetical protein